jgi:integrase
MANVQKYRSPAGEVRYRVKWRWADNSNGSKSFKTKAQAVQFRRRVESQGWENIYPEDVATPKGMPTLRDWWPEFLKAKARRPATVSDQSSTWRCHIEPRFGSIRLDRIKEADVVAWRDEMRRDEAPSTALRASRLLKAMLNHAVETDLLPTTPFRRVRIGSAPTRADVPLPEPDMLAAAIAALPDNVRPAVVLGVATGLRASELCGLRVEDVDFLRGVIHVRRQLLLTAGGGVDDNAPTKTPSSVRDVAVDQGIIDMLAAHLIGRDVSPASPLFLTKAGTPLHRKRLSEAWFNARTTAGLGKVNFHDLRAYAITELIDSGATLKSVSKLAGHTKVTMTSDIYRRARESDDAAIRAGQAGLLAAVTKASQTPARGGSGAG